MGESYRGTLHGIKVQTLATAQDAKTKPFIILSLRASRQTGGYPDGNDGGEGEAVMDGEEMSATATALAHWNVASLTWQITKVTHI